MEPSIAISKSDNMLDKLLLLPLLAKLSCWFDIIVVFDV